MRRGVFIGTWKLESVSDPRYNMIGRGEVHPFILPEDARKRLRNREKEVGPPPKDLVYTYVRDSLLETIYC